MMTVLVAPAPLHAPLHPENTDPTPGVAVRVTTVSDAKEVDVEVHDPLQLIPEGDEVAVPVPVLVPLFTVSVKGCSVNVAVAVVVPVIITLQVSPATTVVLVVVHPVHFVNVDPVPGVANNLTGVPKL